MDGNLRFKIDWASLIVGRKLTVFTLFYFVFEGNFQVQAPGGAYIWRGDLTKGFLCYEFEGAYIWRGLFSEFYGTTVNAKGQKRTSLLNVSFHGATQEKIRSFYKLSSSKCQACRK